MKQSSVDEGTVKITKFPCAMMEPCLEKEEDYDPCANSHDITDKDLEILSKIEAAKRKAETESKSKQEQDKESRERKRDKEKVRRDSKQDGGEKNIQKENGKKLESSRKSTDESTTKGNMNLDSGRGAVGNDNATAAALSSPTAKNTAVTALSSSKTKDTKTTALSSTKDAAAVATAALSSSTKAEAAAALSSTTKYTAGTTLSSTKTAALGALSSTKTAAVGALLSIKHTAATALSSSTNNAAASTVKPERKPCHKKVKNNPFHRDRLALPSCVSPPPRFPPPQLHPPIDEFEVDCPKPRKSKPCRKKKEKLNMIREINTKFKEKGREESTSKSEGKEETEQEQYYEEMKESTKEEEKETKVNTEKEEIKKEYDRSVEEIRPETEAREKRIEEVERRMSEAKAVNRSGASLPKNRKPCMGRIQRPCKKKVSDISISLLPPLIPPLQRDLPSISPKNIPEVKRQTLMAEETKRAVKRERCKNRLANKTKNK